MPDGRDGGQGAAASASQPQESTAEVTLLRAPADPRGVISAGDSPARRAPREAIQGVDDPCHPVGTPDSSFARDADLARPRANPHVPHHQETVLSCLRTILEEGWEHLRYATRDLEVRGGEVSPDGAGDAPHTPDRRRRALIDARKHSLEPAHRGPRGRAHRLHAAVLRPRRRRRALTCLKTFIGLIVLCARMFADLLPGFCRVWGQLDPARPRREPGAPEGQAAMRSPLMSR